MTQSPYTSALVHLECSSCGDHFDPNQVQTFCQACNAPLLARYDLDWVQRNVSPDEIKSRPRGLWRWAELLPVRQPAFRLTLGEGDTPVIPAIRLGKSLGLEALYIKDESRNPTGTFKARGLAVAVSRGLELEIRDFVIPTAGNAGGALAFYAASAGCDAHVFMPISAPEVNKIEVRMAGAELHLVGGTIHDAARAVEAKNPPPQERGGAYHRSSWFNVSTFREPYRVEGKKTMGFEIAEAFGWRLPDVIIYPTGGGTGLVGIWKAIHEMETLGWIEHKHPRLVSVQASGCAPIVRAFQRRAEKAELWEGGHTIASGLCVPHPFADRLMLKTLYESNGTAVAVSDEQILHSQYQLARLEGIFAAPEGAATVAGLQHLKDEGWIQPDEQVLLLNTGSGLKYL